VRPVILSVALVVALGTAAPGAFAQSRAHAAPAATSAAPAQRYASDATLRQQMREIRGEVSALGHYEHGHLDPKTVTQLAGQIIGHVNTIISNCKLPPDADEALHLIIGPLLQHAAALQADPKKLDAIPPMREALAKYASQFDDPGFAEPAE
jgi:hypothetical protein